MTSRKLSLIVLTVAVAGIAAAVLSQIGLGGSGKVQIGTGKVSALSRAGRTSDALPSSVLSYPFAAHNFASPDGAGARLVKTDGSLELYAVPGKSGMVCLIEVDDLAQTAGGACADRHVLLTGSIYMADRQEDGSRQVVGLVGDGHAYAEANGRRTSVENNVFVLPEVEGSQVTIGSATAAQTIDLGD
jgi:hypothetical protein